jgi:hypothetical protein
MALSITVSFAVMGAGLKHLADGLAAGWVLLAKGGLEGMGEGLLRAPSPLVLRASTGADRTLTVKQGGGGADAIEAPPPALAGPEGRDTIALPGARSLAADLAAASVLARMAEEEAQLQLYLEGDGEEKGVEKRSAAAVEGEEGEEPAPQPPAPSPTPHGPLLAAFAAVVSAVRAVRRALAVPIILIFSTARIARASLLRRVPWLGTEPGMRASLYATAFGGVWLTAQAQPSGFLASLEIFTSLALNVSCGLLVGTMYANARRMAEGRPPLHPLVEGGRASGEEEEEEEEDGSGDSAGLLSVAETGLVEVVLDGEGEGGAHARAHVRPGSGKEEEGDGAAVGTPKAAPALALPTPTFGRSSAPPWVVPPAFARALPIVAWVTFGAAAVYDIVETLARGMDWADARWVMALVSVSFSHTALARSLRRMLRAAGLLLRRRASDRPQRTPTVAAVDGRWAVAWAAAAIAAAGMGGGSGLAPLAFLAGGALSATAKALRARPAPAAAASCLAAALTLLGDGLLIAASNVRTEPWLGTGASVGMIGAALAFIDAFRACRGLVSSSQ